MKDEKTTLMLITHNLGLVAWLCDEICVMYAGQIVERADVKSIFKEPLHPYTRALLRTIPRIDVEIEKLKVEGLDSVNCPLILSYDLSQPDYVEDASDIVYFSPVVDPYFESNPFKLEKREYPVEFNHPYTIRESSFINIL